MLSKYWCNYIKLFDKSWIIDFCGIYKIIQQKKK